MVLSLSKLETGSDHNRSQKGPLGGGSENLSIFSISSNVGASGEIPP